MTEEYPISGISNFLLYSKTKKNVIYNNGLFQAPEFKRNKEIY